MSSLLDIKQFSDSRPWEVTAITVDKQYVDISWFKPFFYVVVKNREDSRYVLRRIEVLAREWVSRYEQKFRNLTEDELEVIKEKPVFFEELPSWRAWIFDEVKYRYVVGEKAAVYKVKVWHPRQVADLAKTILEQEPDLAKKCALAAFNIKYCARVGLSIPGLFLDIIPVYYDLDTAIYDKLARVRYLVYDIEKVPDGSKEHIVVSVLETSLFEDVKYDDEILTFRFERLPDGTIRSEQDLDCLRDVFKKALIIVGYNNLNFDDKELVALGVLTQSELEEKVSIDLLPYIRNQASALGVGLTGHGLAEVLIAYAKKAGIPRENIEIKLRAPRMIRSVETAVPYNRKDVESTDRIAKAGVLQTIFALAGATKMPVSMVYQLRPGVLYEYALVKWFEIHGEIIEARRVFTSRDKKYFKAWKVFTYEEVLHLFLQYRDKLARALEEGLDKFYQVAYAIADDILKKVVKPLARQGEHIGERRIRKTFGDAEHRVEHGDVDRMYPTNALKHGTDPCCVVIPGGKATPELIEKLKDNAEDVVFDDKKLPSPALSFLSRLYYLRDYAKSGKKEAEKRGDVKAAATFEVLDKVLKALINSYYGAAGKSSGYAHGGHPLVPLKIFLSSVRDLIIIALYAIALGYLPIYMDTDSIFVVVPRSLPEGAAIAKLNEFASRYLGYRLSYEDSYDYMHIFAAKSYLTIKVGKSATYKGQLVSRLKQYTSPLVRDAVIRGTAELSVKPVVDLIKTEEDLLVLVPSRGKRICDMFMYDVETLKRKRREEEEAEVEEEESGDVKKKRKTPKIKVAYVDPATKTTIYTQLKCLSPTQPHVAPALASLALIYGKRVKKDLYLVDFRNTSMTDIVDLRGVLLARAVGDRLTGDKVLVMVPRGDDYVLYLVQLVPEKCRYVLAAKMDRRLEIPDWFKKMYSVQMINDVVRIEVPLDYRSLMQRLAESRDRKDRMLLRLLTDRVWKLEAVKVGVQILRKVTPEEAKGILLEVLYEYFKWAGIAKLFKDIELLEREVLESRLLAFQTAPLEAV